MHIDKAYLENRNKPFSFVLGKNVNKDVSIIWSENDIASKVKSSVYNANLYFADYSYQHCIEYLKNNLIECWENADMQTTKREGLKNIKSGANHRYGPPKRKNKKGGIKW